MKMILKKLTAFLLALVLCLSAAQPMVQNAFAETGQDYRKKVKDYRVGETFEYGRYPQASVTDQELTGNLGKALTDSGWRSFRYYSGTGAAYDGKMTAGDWMQYQDVSFEGKDYRAVRFSQYRPIKTGYTSSAVNSYQDENGYSTDTVYWFEYCPITWTVLDPRTGLVVSADILDAQTVNSYLISQMSTQGRTSGFTFYYNNLEKTNLANFYEYSELRKWLNDGFYQTAFAENEKEHLIPMEMKDLTETKEKDKVSLLSSEQAVSRAYGLASAAARTCSASAYAKCGGIRDTSWILRTRTNVFRDSLRMTYVDPSGNVLGHNYPNSEVLGSDCDRVNGIRPLILLDPETVVELNVFLKNSYIADLWLGINGREGSVESKEIGDVLKNVSIASELSEDTVLKIGVGTWETMKAFFDIPGSIKETVTESSLYETLLFDLIQKTLNDRQNEFDQVLSAATTDPGKAESISKAGSIVSYFADLASSGKSALDVCREWKLKPTSRTANEFLEKLGKSKVLSGMEKAHLGDFVTGLGLIAGISTDVSEFYVRGMNYLLAAEAAAEMKTMLETMRANVSYSAFRTALDNMIRVIGDAKFAERAAKMTLGRDAGATFVGLLVDEMTDLLPVYSVLKAGYKAGTFVSDILFNTSSVVGNYFVMQAAARVTAAAKTAIGTLGNTYRNSVSEADAGAYVYAMQTYKHIYLIDLESALNYIREACEEGVVNKARKIGRKALNVISDVFDLDRNFEGTYDEALRSKENIVQSLTLQFDSLLSSWCFNGGYLRQDFPSMYPLYAAEFYTAKFYAPRLLSARYTDNGETNLVWSTDCIYRDEEGVAHALFGTFSLTGVDVTEEAGGVTVYKTKDYQLGESSMTFASDQTMTVFPKQYTITAFEDFNGEKIYTGASSLTMESPCQPVKLSVSLVKQHSLRISDPTPMKYGGISYHIFRKEADAPDDTFTEIAEIGRKKLFGGQDTWFEDTDMETGKVYTYKVQSVMPLKNGLTLEADSENRISVVSSEWMSGLKILKVTDRRSDSAADAKKKAPARAKTAGGTGVSLSWESVENASGYQIFRKSEYADDYRLLADVAGGETSYLDETAALTIGYDYRVVAYKNQPDGTPVFDLSDAAAGNVAAVLSALLPGDVDGSGDVTSADARLALRASVRLEDYQPGSAEFLAADVDGSGDLSASDARLILRASVGLETLG